MIAFTCYLFCSQTTIFSSVNVLNCCIYFSINFVFRFHVRSRRCVLFRLLKTTHQNEGARTRQCKTRQRSRRYPHASFHTRHIHPYIYTSFICIHLRHVKLHARIPPSLRASLSLHHLSLHLSLRCNRTICHSYKYLCALNLEVGSGVALLLREQSLCRQHRHALPGL